MLGSAQECHILWCGWSFSMCNSHEGTICALVRIPCAMVRLLKNYFLVFCLHISIFHLVFVQTVKKKKTEITATRVGKTKPGTDLELTQQGWVRPRHRTGEVRTGNQVSTTATSSSSTSKTTSTGSTRHRIRFFHFTAIQLIDISVASCPQTAAPAIGGGLLSMRDFLITCNRELTFCGSRPQHCVTENPEAHRPEAAHCEQIADADVAASDDCVQEASSSTVC